MKRLDQKEVELDKQLQKNKTLNLTLQENIDNFNRLKKDTTKTTDKMIKNYSYVTHVIDELRQELDEFQTDKTIESNIMQKVDAKIIHIHQ